MGHGDEIVLADAHFPGETYGQRVLRADGLRIPDLLDAILPLFVLDSYVEYPLIMMSAVSGDQLDTTVEASYRQAIDKHWPDTPPIQRIDRFDFYGRAKQAFAVFMTGDGEIWQYHPKERCDPHNLEIRVLEVGEYS